MATKRQSQPRKPKTAESRPKPTEPIDEETEVMATLLTGQVQTVALLLLQYAQLLERIAQSNSESLGMAEVWWSELSEMATHTTSMCVLLKTLTFISLGWPMTSDNDDGAFKICAGRELVLDYTSYHFE